LTHQKLSLFFFVHAIEERRVKKRKTKIENIIWDESCRFFLSAVSNERKNAPLSLGNLWSCSERPRTKKIEEIGGKWEIRHWNRSNENTHSLRVRASNKHDHLRQQRRMLPSTLL
jgi:hypothetical protein